MKTVSKTINEEAQSFNYREEEEEILVLFNFVPTICILYGFREVLSAGKESKGTTVPTGADLGGTRGVGSMPGKAVSISSTSSPCSVQVVRACEVSATFEDEWKGGCEWGGLSGGAQRVKRKEPWKRE